MGAPKVVLDHYRNPRNKRDMPDATATGSVAGRKPGTAVTLFLKVVDGRIADASFTNTGDRQEDPATSALTELVRGKSLDEARAIDQLAIARALDSADSPAIAAPAFDAWRQALARARGEPDPLANEARLICHCLHVPEGRIRRAIRERRLATVEDVSHWVRSTTGCRSCRPDVEQILAEERQAEAR